jgi:hypothetical protein
MSHKHQGRPPIALRQIKLRIRLNKDLYALQVGRVGSHQEGNHFLRTLNIDINARENHVLQGPRVTTTDGVYYSVHVLCFIIFVKIYIECISAESPTRAPIL